MKQQIRDIQKMRKWKFSWRLLWENFVFRDAEHFYKMPTFLAKNIMYRKNDSYEKVVDAMRILKTYFWPLAQIPKTQILKDSSGHYVIKQKSIPWDKLTRKMLEDNPKLLSKFKRLIIANEIMWLKEWVFLDLLGSDIVTHPQTIHNLLTDGENIYVFDFGLLEKNSKNIFFRYFSHFGTWFQLLFIKSFY
jgi:hypothetical protein